VFCSLMLLSSDVAFASVVGKVDPTIKTTSSKVLRWKCTNRAHPKSKPKQWDEVISKRVMYRWCPTCSLRRRKGGKCIKCNRTAYHNVRGEKGGAYCSIHKTEGMINVAKRRCKECDTEPCFNKKGEPFGIYCDLHKKAGMINVKNKLCQECGIVQATFGLRGTKRALFCASHKKKGMIDVKNKLCEEKGCDLHANFNFEGEKTPRFCSLHKKDGMDDIKNARCAEKNCKGTPVYNSPGETIRKYCSQHKKEGMINVKNKRCAYTGCPHIPTFNKQGEKSAKYCEKHKLKDMIDVRHDSELCECGTRCTFVAPDGKKYCGDHKPADAKSTDKKCLKCGIRPSFNLPTETRPLYCGIHKELGMVNVINRLCKCGTRASFGLPGQFPSACAQDVKKGMVKNPRTKCKHKNCKEFATMGTRDTRGEFCDLHAPAGYFSLIRTICKGCKLPNVVDKNGLCVDCDPKTIKRYRLAKQKQVIAWLDTDDVTKEHTSIDKVLKQTKACGSNMHRPDIYYECEEGYAIIVEVDENQHNSDSYVKCDIPRMINLHQDIMAPVYFIRYNPDPYHIGKKEYNPTDNLRKKTLINAIKQVKQYAEEDKVTDGLHVLYLFYDDYDKAYTQDAIDNAEWEDIDPFE
jgi:hypothetical protein